VKPTSHSKRKITYLQIAAQIVTLVQPKVKQRSLISEVQNFRTLFHLYFAPLLFVPVFTEILRKYPILPFVDRMSCSDYELPAPTGTGTVTLPGGTAIYIPVLALHNDPTYFPEPEKFDPDRFTEENKHSRPKYAFLPFSDGPRMCIGKDRHISVFLDTRGQKTG